MMIRKSDYTEHGGLDGRFFCTYGGDRPLLAFECPGGQESDVPPPLFGCLSCGWSIAEKDNPMKTYLNFRNNLLMIFKNVPGKACRPTFLVRLFFDILAYVHLLLQGNFRCAHAVIDAYRDFLKMMPSYKPVREVNLRMATTENIPVQYRKSILLDFYFF